MGQLDFYNTNQHIRYPLLENLSTNALNLSLLMVDAGFVFGPNAAFDPYQHILYLDRLIVVPATSVTFDFRTTAPGMAGLYRFLVTFDVADPIGTTKQVAVDAFSTEPVPPNSFFGGGFVTVGDISEALALGSIGWAAGTMKLEPAVVQALGDSIVTSLNLANGRRKCPKLCCESSSSSTEGAVADVTVIATGLVGDIKFRTGYNNTVEVDEDDDDILVGGTTGAGIGEPCQDVFVDEIGIYETDCQDCIEGVASINGHEGINGVFRVVGGRGLKTTDYPDLHKIVIEPRDDKACDA